MRRFKYWGEMNCCVEDTEGEMVLFKDHQAAIRDLQSKLDLIRLEKASDNPKERNHAR